MTYKIYAAAGAPLEEYAIAADVALAGYKVKADALVAAYTINVAMQRDGVAPACHVAEVPDTDPNTPPASYTPEVLDTHRAAIDKLRGDLLFGMDDAGADEESVQHYLLAVSLLEQAQRHLKLASLQQVRALADHRGGR